jgi:hypothetical protein
MLTAPIRLIALDMDGTVLDDNKVLTEHTAAVLRAAIAQGVHIVPATGRAANGIPKELLAIPGVRYAITANGARIQDLATGETLCERYIPRDVALDAYDRLMHYDCLVDIFQDGLGYTTPQNLARGEEFIPLNLRLYVNHSRQSIDDMRSFIAAQENGLEKFTLFFRDENERRRAWAEMKQLSLEVVSSLERNMELNAHNVNKGQGLLLLAEQLGLPVDSLMACGDGGNDLEMIKAAGLGVAMGNAFEEVKAAANFITRTNNEDGVAYAIEKFVLHSEI